MEELPGFDKKILLEIVTKRMPFGKYKGTLIADIPIFYLEWFLRKGGFPDGKLGVWLATTYEIKNNGLQEIIETLKKMVPPERS
ncbi:DUF3820 family protein [Jiulongibacter sediminis]|jgi:uncharacterized protein (DUF3820 family)|uniref:Cytoplasmic protein n=1 Tax=Jiulongibacter sediminis TaxID=1605367 RepID=A0A0P7C6S5_9BACT|nr:DUF3820 family protein [Jiulongibacter sediminis]KPM50050.1 hypothetical protein AFM12_05765 [Jiulongibacter sediminis]TBX27076.1 hypothetical protein TK44_05770 [Jiulongibacter sediminis]